MIVFYFWDLIGYTLIFGPLVLVGVLVLLEPQWPSWLTGALMVWPVYVLTGYGILVSTAP